MGSSQIARQCKWIWLQGHKCIKLYDLGCRELPFHRQTYLCLIEYCRSFGLTMKELIKRTTEWAASYHTYRQRFMVSQARGDNTVLQGTHHKTFARRWNATSWLWSLTELGFLIWSCCEATRSSPRKKRWQSMVRYLNSFTNGNVWRLISQSRSP